MDGQAIQKAYPWLWLQLDLHSTPNGLPRGEQTIKNMGLTGAAIIKVKTPLTMKLSTRDLRRHGYGEHTIHKNKKNLASFF